MWEKLFWNKLRVFLSHGIYKQIDRNVLFMYIFHGTKNHVANVLQNSYSHIILSKKWPLTSAKPINIPNQNYHVFSCYQNCPVFSVIRVLKCPIKFLGSTRTKMKKHWNESLNDTLTCTLHSCVNMLIYVPFWSYKFRQSIWLKQILCHSKYLIHICGNDEWSKKSICLWSI